ncbi:hypothetical protein [Streptomyces gobiensis]|uniref:hypothetical protein n=1 Tax=Streptomyces gobiensis TaxID=2875706 RepID=UPI001E3ACF53|nr:hypothetical protein [Streptomyces gobiensis]UGY90942.1 hypothetical protein test1122_03845 [Streptomyces gobiensis]
MTKRTPSPSPPAPEPESLAQLRGDCARMAPHWTADHPGGGETANPVSPSLLHGVTVPPRSAQLLDGMSDYGD